MSTHFCKVGKIKPNLKKTMNKNAIEDKAGQFVEIVFKKKTPKGFDVAS